METVFFLTTLETDGDVCSLKVKFWQLELMLEFMELTLKPVDVELDGKTWCSQ